VQHHLVSHGVNVSSVPMRDPVSVTMHVKATPERVYALVSDLPRMGEWSPECYRCRWMGDVQQARPGARFKGWNRIGIRRWTTKGTIVTAEPPKEVSFDIHSVFDLPVARWTYRITPDGNGGCDVTEAWADRRGGVMKLLGNVASGVTDRAAHNTDGMQKTLQRIKETAESS
nr:SRPBCC family protein [Actinomycetota bacterium]